jgi:hypothetical protein
MVKSRNANSNALYDNLPRSVIASVLVMSMRIASNQDEGDLGFTSVRWTTSIDVWKQHEIVGK